MSAEPMVTRNAAINASAGAGATNAELLYKYHGGPVLAELANRYDKAALGSPLAARHILAIGYIESKLIHVLQLSSGGVPRTDLARSLWQFEPGEGAALAGILRHPSTMWARHEIERMGYPLEWPVIWWAVAYDVRLAIVCARALLWTDASPFRDDEQTAYALYLRTWRPGKPRPEAWPEAWRIAGDVIAGVTPVLVSSPDGPLVPRDPPYQPMPEPDEPTQPKPPASDKVVLIRMRAGTPVYWTGRVAWAGKTTHEPSMDDRRSEARELTRDEHQRLLALWPILSIFQEVPA